MSAAQRVFDVAELLEIIVCQCAPHQIRELKQVARSWRDMITPSSAGKRAAVLETCKNESATGKTTFEEPLFNLFQDTNCALYISADWIRINPHLRQVHYSLGLYRDTNHPYYDVVIVIPSTVPQHVMDEHIAHPPMASIAICTCYWCPDMQDWVTSDNLNICMAHNIEGLKIKDLLATHDAMAATQCNHVHDREPSDTIIQATFEIQNITTASPSEQDKVIDSLYFHSYPPRYRKASDRPSGSFHKARHKDCGLEWHTGYNYDQDKFGYQSN